MVAHSKPITLIILDGWGHREAADYNPIQAADTPFIDTLFKDYPYMLLSASGQAVGLPKHQIGNSEVGHLHIGAGRSVPQSLSQINHAIENNQFPENAAFLEAIRLAKIKNSTVHVLGLLSDGGVHSHQDHITALFHLLHQHNNQCYFHAFLDGRDTLPKSALSSLKKLRSLDVSIASVIGRYYAMDRDQRWERTQKAYDLLTGNQAAYYAETAEAALEKAYQRGETDEFVKPTLITSKGTSPNIIKNNDVLIFMNFRADRMRQLVRAFIQKNPMPFERQQQPKLGLCVTLTEYSHDLKTTVAFHFPPLKKVLGECLAQHQLKQLRIAETEKYAHVTYFINGGREKPFEGEDRILVPSPKISTYDLKPAMSAPAITDQLITAIQSQQYDVIICNYANADMIGHTGKYHAAKQAVSVIDQCLTRVIHALQQVKGEALITADHGNIEVIYDESKKQAHTAHTNNPVPCIYIGRPAIFQQHSGTLKDIAPTLLTLLGLKKPKEMTGNVLLKLNT